MLNIKWKRDAIGNNSARSHRYSYDLLIGSAPDAATLDRWGAQMSRSQQGCCTSFRFLLTEISAWLETAVAVHFPEALANGAALSILHAIHDKRQTYDPARPFGPWLAAIVAYKLADIRRHQRHGAKPHRHTGSIARQ